MAKYVIFVFFICMVSSINAEVKKIEIKNHINYFKPDNNFKNSVNYYSIIHFSEYALLGLIKSVKVLHFWMISLGWEIIELFVPYEWARESWLNKLFDLGFNFSRFFVSRKYFMRKS